jgi:hypothetical protein
VNIFTSAGEEEFLRMKIVDKKLECKKAGAGKSFD